MTDLLATCWSSAGDAASDRADLRSPLTLRERIEAASAAGFTGFGLLSADLPAAEKEHGLNGIRAMLDDNGMVDLELEGIPYWWDDGPRRPESDRIRHALLRAETLGARHIKVTPDGDDAPWDPTTGRPSSPSSRRRPRTPGHEAGHRVLPWSNVKTLHDGLQLVEAAGHAEAGVVIDVWHIERAHTPVADLASVPLHRSSGSSSTTPIPRSSARCTRTRSIGAGIAARVFDLTGHDRSAAYGRLGRPVGRGDPVGRAPISAGRRGARPCCRKRPTRAGRGFRRWMSGSLPELVIKRLAWVTTRGARGWTTTTDRVGGVGRDRRGGRRRGLGRPGRAWSRYDRVVLRSTWDYPNTSRTSWTGSIPSTPSANW